MSAEQETKYPKKWTLKRVEVKPEGLKIVETPISASSRDDFSLFVLESLEEIETKIERLNIPIKSRKAHGARRPLRELKEIRKEREGEKKKFEAAAELLRGETNQLIEFIRAEDGSIAGFRPHQRNGTKEINS